MTEVYVHFFILLSIFLLLKSFNKESKFRIAYFISGAISFGFALNTKLIAIELAVPILVMILFYYSFNEKINFGFFRNKKNLLKVTSLLLVFFVVSSIAFVAISPRYYDNTLNQILNLGDEAEIGFASLPTLEKNYLFRGLTTLQVTLLPYIMDSYIDDVFSEEARETRLAEAPSNYSSIPLTLFFFIGLITIIKKIKNRNLSFSELAILVWFTCSFVFTVLVVDFAWIERYYLPVMFPIILIASYSLGNFIKQIQSQTEKIIFFLSFMVAQSLYIIPFIEEIYNSTNSRVSPWSSPLPVSSQLSLNDPIVFVSSITFVMIFILIYLRIKTRISVETKQTGRV